MSNNNTDFNSGILFGIIGVMAIVVALLMGASLGENTRCRNVVRVLSAAKQTDALALLKQHLNCGDGS